MAKKVSFEAFKNRFMAAHPKSNVEFIGYTAITRPVTIVCKDCGKNHHYQNCNRAISGYHCCEMEDETTLERVKKWIDKSDEFEFIGMADIKSYILVKHIKCGRINRKSVNKFFTCPNACSYCDNKSKAVFNSVADAQKNLDRLFFGKLELLEYTGRHSKCKYRCTNCGQIFEQKYDCLLGSAGCPKCDRRRSLGEQYVESLLKEHGLNYRIQVPIKELHKQRFDFGVYDDEDNLLYFIEVQGEQHYYNVSQWGGEKGLARRQELDEKKKQWCMERGIPLYELVYLNKKFKNLAILPF